VVSKFIWTKFNCFSVKFKCLFKVSSFVKHCSLSLDSLSFLLEVNCVPLLLWECGFFGFFSLSLVFNFLGFGCYLGFLFKLVLLGLIFLLILIHLEQIDPSKLLEDIHESWIGLKQLHHHLWVLLAHGPFCLECWVFKVFGNSWVGLKFSFTFWSEHAA